MAYTKFNYKTAKAVREAVRDGQHVEVYQPGPFGSGVKDGSVALEGPHYPAAHTWYLAGEVKDGVLIKVKR